MIPLDFGEEADGRAWIGRETSPRHCELPLNLTQGRVLSALVQDGNPAFWDEDFALARFGRPVVPPSALLTWALPLPWAPYERKGRRPLWAQVPLPGEHIINAGAITTFDRVLFAGESLEVVESVVDISPLRRTRLGEGYFVTLLSTYRDVDGKRVAVNENTLLRYTGDTEAPEALPPGAAGVTPVAHRAERVVAEIPITRATCALNVTATYDFFPGHHDVDYARSQGTPDTYVNTMFWQALADRVVAEVAGYEQQLMRRELRMGRPAHVGETVVASAVVINRSQDATTVDVSMRVSSGEECASVNAVTRPIGTT